MFPSAQSIQFILPLASIFFLFLSFRKSIYGVIAYFIILNAKVGDMYPVLGKLRIELLAAIIVFISILYLRKGLFNALPRKNRLNSYFWILFAVCMLSVPQAVNVGQSWRRGGYEFIKVALFYIMVVSSVYDKSDLKKMIFAFILMATWIAYEPVTNYLNGIVGEQLYGDIAYGRFGAATGHVALANTLSQGIPLTYFYFKNEEKKILKFALLSILMLLTLGVVFTKSRGGFINIIAIACGLVYFSERRARTLFVTILALLFLLPLAGSDYLSRISTISDGIFASRSSKARYWGWRHGITMMIKRPLLGVGIGCYADAREKYFRYRFWAHNTYGELFGELGLASATWFLWVFMIFKKTILLKRILAINNRNQKYYFNILTGIQLSLFLRLVAGNFSHGAFIWFWFLMAALVVSIENCIRSEDIIGN